MIFPQITAILSIAIAALVIVLSLRVSIARQKTGTLHGDDGDNALQVRIRAHGNLMEYSPFFLILLSLLEMRGTGTSFVPLLACSFFVLRLLHLAGLNYPEKFNAGRAIGAIGTLLCIALASLALANTLI